MLYVQSGVQSTKYSLARRFSEFHSAIMCCMSISIAILKNSDDSAEKGTKHNAERLATDTGIHLWGSSFEEDISPHGKFNHFVISSWRTEYATMFYCITREYRR